MKLTITSIKLKSPIHFFALSLHGMRIRGQLQKSAGLTKTKVTGFWTKHYTMTLWNDEASLRSFARNGHHLAAMKKSASLAKEISTLTIDADSLPTWKEATRLLHENGRIIQYNVDSRS
ncbi:MAG TPA: DUF3291 domain-containing protein [Chryseosolibacter sp.]|nr:DUF3291 domain-containing protein [Chryseosolibacter sp.]